MSCLQSSDLSDADKSRWSPAGWKPKYGKKNRICKRGYIHYTTICTCGPSKLEVCGAPHKVKEFSDVHGDHRPEYCTLKRLPDEVYPDDLSVHQRARDPQYQKYQQRVRSLGFYTTVNMLEDRGFCLPEEQQRHYDEHLSKRKQTKPSMQHDASAATASTEKEEDGEEGSDTSSDNGISHGDSGDRGQASLSRTAALDANTGTGRGGRKVQVAPVGTTVYYGRLSYKKQIAYRVTCTCGGTGKTASVLLCVPHEIRHWAEKHGDCKPQFRALKALEDEQYTLLAGFDKERTGDPRYKKYQQRMRDLGFLSTVPMLKAKGYCLPEEAQAKYDSLYPKRERTHRAPIRRASSTEESAGQSEDTEDMEYNGSEVSHITAEGRRRTPKHVDVATPCSRKRRSNAPAAGQPMDSEPAKPAQSCGRQDAAAESTHRVKRPKKSRATFPATKCQTAAVLASTKFKPATSMQPQDGLQAAVADSDHLQGRANMRTSAAPAGQLTCAVSPSAAAAMLSHAARDSSIKTEPAGSAEPPFTPDAAMEGTHKGRRTCAMQPVNPPPIAVQSTPTRLQALNNDGAVDLTLDSPTSSARQGNRRPTTGVYTLSDAIDDITRLKAVESEIAAGGVRIDIDIDRVLQCLKAASTHERLAQELAARVSELQAEASAERRDHDALLELQRRAARNEKLLAAKDNEIKALREQVELQKG